MSEWGTHEVEVRIEPFRAAARGSFLSSGATSSSGPSSVGLIENEFHFQYLCTRHKEIV
jgi:hypothetical protein